jgi:hypothetical protein
MNNKKVVLCWGAVIFGAILISSLTTFLLVGKDEAGQQTPNANL